MQINHISANNSAVNTETESIITAPSGSLRRTNDKEQINFGYFK